MANAEVSAQIIFRSSFTGYNDRENTHWAKSGVLGEMGKTMAYSEFTLSVLTRRFDLTLDETSDLFADVPEIALRPEFLAQLAMTLPLAIATSTEKARSEFIIAPLLLELWLLHERKIGLLSGVEFTMDEAQGLSGICDYILTRQPEQLFVTSPILMLVEAKNEELKRGFAQQFNEREGNAAGSLYGVVTIGELWRFLQLDGKTLRIDARSYHIERVPKIMGILWHLTQ